MVVFTYIKRMLFALVALLLWESVSSAASIDGDYIRKNELASSTLRVFDCSGGKGIRIVKSSHKPSQGKTIMCGAKKNGNVWSGKILNLEDGKHYSATISNSRSKLKIR